MKIFCIIPAFNEEKTIKEVINGVKPLVDGVVVVDDGSIDNTYDLAISAGIITLRHIMNRGQGAALRTGTEYALKKGADVIVHFDADGQFMANDLEKVVEPIIKREAEIVFGSRFLKNTKGTKMPFLKKYYLVPLARLANKLFFNVSLTDPQSGFRAMSKKAALQIEWRQDRMAHCSEILSEAVSSGLKIKEVPIKIIYYSFGQRFSGGLKILKDLFLAKLIN